MSERRREQRWPAYLGGLIVRDPGEQATDCLIRSTSPCGARLVLGEGVPLPDEFSLRIPARQRDMRVHACWRKSDEVGVETVPAHRRAALDRELARQLGRLAALQAELARHVAEPTESPA